jgi:hypothetical protein
MYNQYLLQSGAQPVERSGVEQLSEAFDKSNLRSFYKSPLEMAEGAGIAEVGCGIVFGSDARNKRELSCSIWASETAQMGRECGGCNSRRVRTAARFQSVHLHK